MTTPGQTPEQRRIARHVRRKTAAQARFARRVMKMLRPGDSVYLGTLHGWAEVVTVAAGSFQVRRSYSRPTYYPFDIEGHQRGSKVRHVGKTWTRAVPLLLVLPLVGCAAATAQPVAGSQGAPAGLRQVSTPGVLVDDMKLTAGQCHAKIIDQAKGLVLPDPACTPGAVDPAVTQENLKTTICKGGYTKAEQFHGYHGQQRQRRR